MLVLFTDFGLQGPYQGQLKAVLYHEAPQVPVVDLFADAPQQKPMESAYLLAAYSRYFPARSVFVCVVDPGVGSAQRLPVVLQADDRWYVGPGNGLLEIVRRQAAHWRHWTISWRPQWLSATFHGRDLFAPVAARLASGRINPVMTTTEELTASDPLRLDWPDDIARICYIDHYGNAITGLREERVPVNAVISINGEQIPRRTTFADVPVGTPFCYRNSSGLLEIAVNCGRADDYFGLEIGTEMSCVACV